MRRPAALVPVLASLVIGPGLALAQAPAYVAVGDSITAGSHDLVASDGIGFEPVLSDLLTASNGSPVFVANVGVSGATSADGAASIFATLAAYPTAQHYLILYGSNDAFAPAVPSGLGLNPGDPEYNGSYKDSMQQIITAVRVAGKTPYLAKVPYSNFPGISDAAIQGYNMVIDELVAANGIQVTPPDFYTYFQNHQDELADGLHPNDTGYQSMANLWFSVLDPPSPLLAAVLPSSRSVQVGTAATAFATIINTGTSTATGCQIAPGTTLPADFAFQTTDPATNAVTGTVNTPVDIPANNKQTFVFAFTPTAAIPATDVPLHFFCANAMAAPVVSGLNTLQFSASTTPVPDIVALSATLNNDGIVNIPGTTGTGIFAVATVNLGAGGTITVSADTGGVALPVSIALCQTNPSTGHCVNPTVPTTSPVVTTINTNETPTFGFFVTGTSTVPFAPATSRIFVRFKDTGAVTCGSTSVAVRTQ